MLRLRPALRKMNYVSCEIAIFSQSQFANSQFFAIHFTTLCSIPNHMNKSSFKVLSVVKFKTRISWSDHGANIFNYTAKLCNRRDCNNCWEAQPNRPLLHSRRLNNDHYIKTFSVIRCNNHHYVKKFWPKIARFRNFLQ